MPNGRAVNARGFLSALGLGVVFLCGCNAEGQAPFEEGAALMGPLGAPCDLSADGLDPNVLAVSVGASECASGICLLPARAKLTGTTATCTVECSSDDDCATGQKRGTDAADRRCQTGFICRVLIPKLMTNPIACQRLCACRDFFFSDDVDRTPASCL